MATYVNDLRLKEIATGDESGTWGTSTNTNLELIGEALGYGTQDCFSSDANATTTVADGATDPARAMYFKITSSATLSATRELTIAPNTVSRVMIIENATTGSQIITIKQGSGNTVNVGNGAVKVLYLDGAGSGAAVQDALVDLDLTGTTSAVNLDISGNIDVDGTTNLDAVDIDGAVQIDNTVTVGADDTGYDVKFFGATSGAYMLWDESADDLKLVGAAGLTVAGDIDVDGTTNLDVVDIDGAVNMASTLTSGTDVGVNSEYAVLGDDTSSRELKFSQYQTGGSYDNAGHKINATSGYGELALAVGGTNALTLDASQDATLAGNLDVDGSAGIYQRNSSGGSFVLDDTDTADASTPMVYLRNTAGQLTLGRANRNASTGRTTSSTDSLTISSAGDATFAGAVAAASLSIGGTAVTSTAAELNVLDPALKENSSIWIGSDPSGTTSSAQYNVALGVNALDAITTADNSTAIGHNALSALTEGGSNTAVGEAALLANTTGNTNIAVGGRALTTNTVGDRNTAVGYQSLYTLNPAGNADMYNVAVGYNSGYALSVGVKNTLIGSHAGESVTTGTHNSVSGYVAGAKLTTSSYNTAMGSEALYFTTTGHSNVVMGYQAMYGADGATMNGMHNVAIGREALKVNTTAFYNVAVGSQSMMANTTGNYNTAVGYGSLTTQSGSANYNTAVGYLAGADVTTGDENTFVGAFAGEEVSSGNYNTHVGYNAGGGTSANSHTGNYNSSLGRNALSKLEGSAQANTAVGFGTLENLTTASNNTAVGGAAMQVLTTGAGNVAVGNYAGDALTSAGLNTLVGYAAGSDLTTSQYNTAVGHSALKNTTTGNLNIAIGYKALHDNEVGDRNTAIGYEALRELEPASNADMYNVALGFKAGTPASSTTAFTGTKNTLLGSFAGAEITSGDGNVAIGYLAGGGSNTSRSAQATGDYNTSVGNDALESVTSGYANVAIGKNSALSITTAYNNITIGSYAADALATGNENTIVGHKAGTNSVDLEGGHRNVLIGAYCDTTATDSDYATGVGYNLDCEGGYTTIGNASSDIRAAHGTATWSTVSDERYKKDIVDSSAGLNFINALRPRTFKYKTLGELPETFRAYEAGSTEVFKNSQTNHGFIAQEVKAAIDADDSIKDGFKLWDNREDGSQEVAENALIPILVKAIQEQQALIESLTSRIAALEG
jgi:hypothetical protein